MRMLWNWDNSVAGLRLCIFFKPVCLPSSANVCIYVFHCLSCMSACHHHISALCNVDWFVMRLTEYGINISHSSALTASQLSRWSSLFFPPSRVGPLLARPCNCRCGRMFAIRCLAAYFMRVVISPSRGPLRYLVLSYVRFLTSYFTPYHLSLRETVNKI